MINYLGDPYFDKLISRVYHEDKDAIVVHAGERGSTKSGCAITTGEIVDVDSDGTSRFSLPINLVPKQMRHLMGKGWVLPRLIFKPSDFLRLISNPGLPPGSVIVWDETGVEGDARDFATKKNKFLKRVMETIRSMNLIIILTSPTLMSFDIGFRRAMSFFIDFKGKVKINGFYWGKSIVFETTTNSSSGKTYFKKIRSSSPSGKVVKLNKYYFPKPSYQLEKPYKKYKKLFQTALYREYAGELDNMDELLKPEEERKKSIKDLAREVLWDREKYLHPTKNIFVPIILKQAFNLKDTQTTQLKTYLDFIVAQEKKSATGVVKLV